MKRLTLTLSLLLYLIVTPAQSSVNTQANTVLVYTPLQIETLFLQENLQLIAERMNIAIADAEIAQAKLWENPELTISSINLWSTKSQKAEIEARRFPQSTQFSIELSQLIQTANKRSKLIKREKVSKAIAIQEFEDVLRGLKIELRKIIFEIEYLQAYYNILLTEQKSMEQIITAYQKQAVQQNISKNELIRLQAGLIELESEISENQLNMNEYQKQLKSLTNIPPEHIVEIKTTSMEIIDPIKLSLAALLEASQKSRPDVKRHQLQAQYFEKALLYEKSQRVPDITLHASYDRYGGVWKDFIGFGVSFNLPFLNRNQGQIKAAAISVKQSQHLHLHQHNLAQHEITEALQNYTQVHRFYTKITSNSLLEELDQMLQVYTKNMLTRNISMLEYIDFIESFKNSKQSLLNSKKLVNASFEELQYVVGTDITH